MALPAFAHHTLLLLPASRAAINRYLLAAGPTAANPQQQCMEAGWDGRTDRQTAERTDRWMDGGTQESFIDPALYYYVGTRMI